jgi:glutamine synthetase
MAMLAPYAHSYLRIARPDASPASADWGHDDRRVAFRIPQSNPANRRMEHRLPGGDANPYLALALMLGTGLIGMQQQLAPSPARGSSDANAGAAPLPQNLDDALAALEACPLLGEVFGAGFIDLYAMVKRHELTEQAADADFALRHLLVRS